jgi:hypothetical protein
MKYLKYLTFFRNFFESLINTGSKDPVPGGQLSIDPLDPDPQNCYDFQFICLRYVKEAV